jgi:hypothetical protein
MQVAKNFNLTEVLQGTERQGRDYFNATNKGTHKSLKMSLFYFVVYLFEPLMAVTKDELTFSTNVTRNV